MNKEIKSPSNGKVILGGYQPKPGTIRTQAGGNGTLNLQKLKPPKMESALQEPKSPSADKK